MILFSFHFFSVNSSLIKKQYKYVFIIIMKFTPNLTEPFSHLPPKPLYSSASSKMFLGESHFQSCQVQKERVRIQIVELSRNYKDYEWRNSTEFPIVRVRTWQIISSSYHQAQLQVYYQSIPILLEQLHQVPLFKMLYLLKEALIGYERVFNRFGPSKISPQMIGINQFFKCKVWINSHFASNSFERVQVDEREWILQICQLFQQKTVRNKNSINFFSELYNCNHFSAFISFVDHYAKDNKIVIPSFFKHQKINSMKVQPKEDTHKFHPNLTMNRSPKFINNMRETLPTAFNRRQVIDQKKQTDDSNVKFEDKGQQLCLKTSGQTKVDIYGSSTIADSKCKESYFLQSQHFQAEEPKNNSYLQKSELLQFKPKAEKKQRFTHKITNKQMFSCFTPQPRSCQYLGSFQKWDDNSFLQPMNTIAQYKDEAKRQTDKKAQEEDTLVDELQSLFEKNQWQQKIGGLFNDEDQGMKRSLHEGEEPRWKEDNDKELTLLKHFGKMVFQSSCPAEGESRK